MKKFLNVIVLSLIIFSGCKEFDEENEPLLTQNQESNNLKSVGDGVYDCLGYGYDATGLYMNAYSTTYPVIDLNKFKVLELHNIETSIANETSGYYSSGTDSEEFANSLTASLNISCKVPLFAAEVKGSYGITNTNSSAYS